ncbi:MAG: inositol monophosphatase [Polyangiaceae bacterium]|nr:inositol monophosphatase [Polyangiaceae bacterium]
MTAPATPAALTAIALAAARAAAEVARRGHRTRPALTHKGRTDVVTEYDLASEAVLRERLAEATPDIPVVGEEAGGTAGPDRVWYVDPLDGTTNFAHGHPCWCVSVGLAERGVPLVGAVVAPSLGVEWSGWTAAGGGAAQRDGVPIRTSDVSALVDALLATGFPQDRETAPDNNFAAWARVKRAAQGVRRCGSAALDLCFVADGTYDGYWERRLHAWDVTAGAALVRAAGGRVTALDGGELDLERGYLVATNGRLHDALVALVRD